MRSKVYYLHCIRDNRFITVNTYLLRTVKYKATQWHSYCSTAICRYVLKTPFSCLVALHWKENYVLIFHVNDCSFSKHEIFVMHFFRYSCNDICSILWWKTVLRGSHVGGFISSLNLKCISVCKFCIDAY